MLFESIALSLRYLYRANLITTSNPKKKEEVKRSPTRHSLIYLVFSLRWMAPMIALNLHCLYSCQNLKLDTTRDKQLQILRRYIMYRVHEFSLS